MCPSLRYWWQILLLSAYRLEQISAIEQRHFYAEVCGDVLCSFQHMEFDVGNDRLYVGGMNRIYQLRQDLIPEKTAETGPKLDSPECYPHSVCNYVTENTNNYNKLLIIDSDNDRLVACGSIKQGICDLRQLGNVTHVLNEFPPADDPRANDFVASMSHDQTTVAFMALEGRAGRERSLYVGSSRTEHDTKVISDDESFPTITSRRMPRRNKDPTMLSSELTSKQTTSHLTRKDLSSKTKDEKFRVNFVSAFDGDKTGYFVISYPEIADRVNKNRVKSYVSQVCMRGTDEKSTTNSYLEIPIASRTWVNGRESLLTRVITSTTAKVGSLLQNELGIDISVGSPNPDVLFVSFATEGDTASGSTLAMFPMYELDAEYYEMVRGCLNGHSMTHIGWLREGAIPCSKITFPIRRPLCDNNIWDIVGLYQGNRTKIGYTVYESKDTIVTSVAVAKQGKHTVAFMGTDDGQLLKLKIDSKPAGNRLLEPYEKVVIDTYDSKDNHRWKNMGSPSILPDMRLNNEFTRLFVMSERKLSSLPLHDCQKFTTCADCLNAGDPFCGWCTLLDRCAPATECEKGPNYYATSDSSSCPRLTGTNPAALHVSSQSEFIKVDIANIPNAIGGSYWCDFGDAGRTPSTYRDTYVSCNSPLPSKVPNLNGKEIRLPLTLVYAAMGSNIEIAATEIVYYDCNYLSSCLQCLGSASYECHWCVGDNSCVRNGVLCKSYPGNLHNSEECPRLSEVVDPLYIHERKPQNVRLRVDNLGPIITSRPKFQCVFAIDGLPPKKINGSMLSREVLCGPITGFLPADKYEADARIDLYWGDNYLIDNPESLKVRMYRCSHGKGDSCGTCLLRDRDLHCGWCEAEKKCTLCDECTGKTCQSVSGGVYPGWLDEAQVCTHPEILKFTPESAAPGGRTTITIEGINFGRIFRDGREEVKVTVADEDCNIEKYGYQESSRIVCTVENVGKTKNGPVSICLLSYMGVCRDGDYRNSSQKRNCRV